MQIRLTSPLAKRQNTSYFLLCHLKSRLNKKRKIFSSSPSTSTGLSSFSRDPLWPVKREAVDVCNSVLSLQTGAFCSANISPLSFSRPARRGKHYYRKVLIRLMSFTLPKNRQGKKSWKSWLSGIAGLRGKGQSWSWAVFLLRHVVVCVWDCVRVWM